MPSLVLFGKPTVVGGDDLQLFCLLLILFRIAQLILLFPAIIFLIQIFEDTANCQDRLSWLGRRGLGLQFIYGCLSLLLATCSLVLEGLIWRTSRRGTPCTPEERSALKMLCFLKLIPMNVLRLLTLGVGLTTALLIVHEVCACEAERSGANSNDRCPTYDSFSNLFFILMYSHMAEVVSVALYTWYFCCGFGWIRHLCCGWTRWTRGHGVAWKVFCRLCCSVSSILTCCLIGGTEASLKADFSDISVALADFFNSGGHLDIVVSDILVALILVYKEQREQRDKQVASLRRSLRSEAEGKTEEEAEGLEVEVDEEKNADEIGDDGNNVVGYVLQRKDGVMCYERRHRRGLSPNTPLDLQTIAEGARFMQLSAAIYGYLVYLLDYRCEATCALMADCLRCRRSFRNQRVVGDNRCGWNEIALLRAAGITPDCIAYVSFHKSLEHSPYCIVLDHDWKCVVVAIRGTLSLEDAVKDLTITPTCLKECGERFSFDGEHHYAHSGMRASAECLVDDLTKNCTLEQLICGDRCKYPSYSLKITGHSLGAGVAALVGLFLRAKYPNLKCLCFEPPCVVSTSVEMDDFVTSYILGTDIIPRLSLASLENLRDDVLTMVARIKVPKHRVLSRSATLSEAAHRKNSIPVSDFYRKLGLFQLHQYDTKQLHEASQVPQIPPGRLVHLVRTREDERSFFGLTASRRIDSTKREEYRAIYSTCDDLCEIQLSSTIIDDHMPSKVLGEMRKIAARFGLEAPCFLVPQNNQE